MKDRFGTDAGPVSAQDFVLGIEALHGRGNARPSDTFHALIEALGGSRLLRCGGTLAIHISLQNSGPHG